MPKNTQSEFWNYIDRLLSSSQVVIDRPKDSAHPEFEDMIYPVDYGYLAGTTSSDGAGIDVWRGSGDMQQVSGIVCTVDLLKRDAEIKILLGCSEDEMATIVDFLNSEYMGCWLVRR